MAFEGATTHASGHPTANVAAPIARQPDMLAVASTAPVARIWGRFAASTIAMIGMLIFSALHLSHTAAPTMAAVFVAATLSSIGGFAFSAVCGAFLFQFLPPLEAVRLMIVCSIALQAFSVFALRNSIDWCVLSRFLIGGAVSLPVGVYLLTVLDAVVYSRIIGAFLVAYGLFMFLRPALTLCFQRGWADMLAGATGGITGGFAGFPGAFVTIWCALKGWDKGRQRGVYQPFILIMQLAALAIISLLPSSPIESGIPTGMSAAFIFVPAALLGTWCGLGWYRHLSDAQFATAVNLLLIAAGAGLIL